MRLESNHLPADQRRAVTIETMIALAAEQNPSEITTSAIAERMNLTQGALFRHFPTKDDMWQSVMEWVAERLLARIDKAARGAASPLAALEAMFMAHLEFVARHPGIPRMLFGELQRAKDTPAKRMVRTLLTEYAQRLHTLLQQGKDQGEIAPEVDVKAAATLYIGTIQGLIMQSLIAGKIAQTRSVAPGVFTIFVRGLRGAS